LSAGQAAKATGKSVPTITRAIRNGRIAAKKTDQGGFEIDPSALFKIFPPVTPAGDVVAKPTSPAPLAPPNLVKGKVRLYRASTPAKVVSNVTVTHETPSTAHALQGKLKLLEEALTEAKAERDAWRQQAERLTAAIADSNTSVIPPKGSRWPWSHK
jgi:hypothetical protein